MAEFITPTEIHAPAEAPSGPLLSALTRWWAPADAAGADAMLGYESAQPWMLDEAPGESPTHIRY